MQRYARPIYRTHGSQRLKSLQEINHFSSPGYTDTELRTSKRNNLKICALRYYKIQELPEILRNINQGTNFLHLYKDNFLQDRNLERCEKNSAAHQYIKRATKQAGHVARLENLEYIRKLVGECEERTRCGRPATRWENSRKMYINPQATNVIYIYIYIYMEHPFLMFLDHTQRRSTVGRTPLDE